MSQWTALLITLAIEIPIVVVWMGRARSHDFGIGAILAVAAAATLVTHPLVWHVNNMLAVWPFAARAALVETFAVVVEGLIYWKALDRTVGAGMLLSLIANAMSFGLGLAIWYAFW